MKNIETTLDVPAAYPLSELEALLPTLTYINILAAKTHADGELIFEDSVLPQFAEKAGVLPLMTLSCTSPEAAHRLFSDRTGEFTEKLLAHTETGGYKGVSFSFLRVFPFDREKFTSFLEKCAAVLHERGISAGSIVAPPCALSLAAANDYRAQGTFLDRVNFLLSGCLYRKDSLQRRLSDDLISETLDFARENIPPQKLAVTLADHGLVKTGDGETQVLPGALARSLHRDGAEYDTEKSCAEFFKKLTSLGVTGISIRPAGRADRMIFKVLSKRFDILKF